MVESITVCLALTLCSFLTVLLSSLSSISLSSILLAHLLLCSTMWLYHGNHTDRVEQLFFYCNSVDQVIKVSTGKQKIIVLLSNITRLGKAHQQIFAK